MNQTTTLKEKYALILKIIVPILVTQVAIYLISFFDILMSSRYGTADLAGVSIGSSIWMPIYIGLSGILLAITPIVSQLVGAKKEMAAKKAVQQGIYVAIVLAILIFIALLVGMDWILGNMDLEASVHTIAKSYVHAMCAGLIPLFLFFVMRCFIDALGQTRVTMIITLLTTPINIVLNYIFIFGKFGAPELGGIGAGVATAITYWLVFLITVWIIAKRVPFERFRLFHDWPTFEWLRWKEILIIGVPIGISLFAETSIFSAVTMMMSSFSTEIIAAHQIALNFTSLNLIYISSFNLYGRSYIKTAKLEITNLCYPLSGYFYFVRQQFFSHVYSICVLGVLGIYYIYYIYLYYINTLNRYYLFTLFTYIRESFDRKSSVFKETATKSVYPRCLCLPTSSL
ncbi:MATE family efflux transporter [Lysinibacillus sp. NPDC059133]|uniref:MATE family efflux transporter n=1 Tax=Lysinibacillus sp. NPDC059133 TaxID=3346737 RepID=UPI0036840CFF